MTDGLKIKEVAVGPKVATEDLGSDGHLQRIKIVLGDKDSDDGDISSTNPIPVEIQGSPDIAVSGTVSIDNFPGTQNVSGTVAVNNFPGTQPISATSLPLPSGAATEATLADIADNQTNGTQHTVVDNFPSSQAVTGSFLTNTQLRASPVPVDGSGATQPVTGTVTVGNFPSSQAVTGTFLTDAQLRATPIEITGNVTVDAGGLATESKQDTGNSSLASIDTKLSSQATAANQSTANSSLASIDGKLASLGQKAMSGSVPVVIASDQSALSPDNADVATSPVAGTISAQSGFAVIDSSIVNTSPAANSTITANVTGHTTAVVTMSAGTWTGGGTLAVEGTIDGTWWFSLPGRIITHNTGATISNSFSSGILRALKLLIGGCTQIRVRAAGTFTSITTPIAISIRLSRAIDGSFGSPEAPATAVTTNVNGLASLVDNAAFTDGSSNVSPAGYILDDVAGTALSENDVAAARIDSKRAQVLTIEDATTRGQKAVVTAGGALRVAQRATGATVTQVAASATSVTLLSSNTARVKVFLYNNSTSANLYVKLGTTADTSSNYSFILTPGASYEDVNYTGRIDGIWASATGSVQVTEETE